MPYHQMNRRDALLAAAGLAALGIGKAADSSINGSAASDVDALTAAVHRLSSFPMTIGDWHGTDNQLTEREQQVAGIKGYVRREYRNATTGFQVNLTLLCGHSGPMSVHPPTACFEGVGYTLASGPSVTSIDGMDGTQFNRSTFRQLDASFPEIVRVFWAWSTDGYWLAPRHPRIAFRGQPFLYKIYVTDRWMKHADEAVLPQAPEFLRVAVPVIRDVIVDTET